MSDSHQPCYIVITPVRNEEEFLQRTIDSMVSQTIKPAQWVIVDDGSKDATAAIAQRASDSHPWIKLYQRADRGVRKVGGGVIEAFKDGLAQITVEGYEYLCKLDGDLEFEPVYFERMFDKFAADERLGSASGKCWLVTDDGLKPERTRDDYSLGAAKLYRRTCFEAMGGFVQQVMWDGIDVHRSRMLGWKAASFHDDALKIRHLRLMGSSFKSIYHGRLRWGYGQYYMGTHPLYAMAIAAYRMREKPWIVGGLLILSGYARGYLLRQKRLEDKDFRQHLRRWQLSRLGIGREPKAEDVALVEGAIASA